MLNYRTNAKQSEAPRVSNSFISSEEKLDVSNYNEGMNLT